MNAPRYSMSVVGVSFEPHRTHIRELIEEIAEERWGPLTNEGRSTVVPAHLSADPHNPHDPQAVGVYADGKRVGYVSRHYAPLYARDMFPLITALEIAVWPSYGPRLRLDVSALPQPF